MNTHTLLRWERGEYYYDNARTVGGFYQPERLKPV